MNVFSAEQLYLADQETIRRQGITSIELMERAAHQLFEWLHQRLQGAQAPIKIFCGIGNNGGDGLALGRMLVKSGYNVSVYIANFSENRSNDFLTNYDRYKEATKVWPILMSSEADFPELQQDDIVVDCLFGIGLNRAPEGWVKKLIQHINAMPAFTLSVDIPSGLAANAPLMDPEAVVEANHTLSFQHPKMCFFLPQTGRFVPYFQILDIGLDQAFLNSLRPIAQLVYQPLAQSLYRQRDKFSHKGTYGHALIVGGSKGKMGAITLASKAALKAGAGLVSTYIPASGNTILQTALPEVMCLLDSSEDILTSFAIEIEASAYAVGMGMGTADATVNGFEKFLENTKAPLVLDADALNCIALRPSLKKYLSNEMILTPHEGELKRLVGEWKDDFEKWEKAKQLSKETNCIIVLKGAHTLIIEGDNTYINTTGNPGMATAGSGDTLSGLLAGLLAQGYGALEASILGVYLHGSAGNSAAHEIGYEALTASEIINRLGMAFIALFENPNATAKEQENTASENTNA